MYYKHATLLKFALSFFGTQSETVLNEIESGLAAVIQLKYYTPEVGGSSVWQISKKYFAGVIYGQKSLMC